MKQTAALLLLALTACASLGRGEGDEDEPAPEPLRLCVQNQTAAHGNIIARAGLVRFDVMPGEQVCKEITVTGVAVDLRAVTIGGGASGPLSYAERLQPGGSSCWRWRLTDSRASSVDLMPCQHVLEGDQALEDTVPVDSSSPLRR